MGIAASQARLIFIVARQSDIELRMEFNTMERAVLAEQASKFSSAATNTGNVFDLASSQQNYQSTMTAIHTKDRQLAVEMQSLETQHKMVSTEYESVKKVINKNIERSFKYLS